MRPHPRPRQPSTVLALSRTLRAGSAGAAAFAAIVSVPLAVVFYAFEIFVTVLQAYIFAILTQVYIELAMFREDH